MICMAVTVAITAVLLAGAAPSYIGHRVYLVQLSYVNARDWPSDPFGAWLNVTTTAFEAVRYTHLTVRVGYFGICAAQEEVLWICRGSGDGLMASHRFTDPLGIITMAEQVKNEVMFPGLL
jgi:hypothetical protein